MKLHFEASTRDSYFAYLLKSPAVSIEVFRNRSWKRFQPDRPWRVQGFGDSFANSSRWFATADEAMTFADGFAEKTVQRLAKLYGGR